MAWSQVAEEVKEGLRAINLEEMQLICTLFITEFDIEYKQGLQEQNAPELMQKPVLRPSARASPSNKSGGSRGPSPRVISSKKTPSVSKPSPRLPSPDDTVEKEKRQLEQQKKKMQIDLHR